MLQDLHVLHRRKPLIFDNLSVPVWATCLRSLAFVKASHKPGPGDELFAQEGAYKFILEVICGMHSPIIGETEVFGQFKNFAAEWTKEFPQRKPLVQRLLADAKQIRSQQLNGLGHQSYGSWIRKHLSDKQVHILGAGHLAQEIVPYLCKAADQVILHLRDTGKASFYTGPKVAIDSKAFASGALVIAAPMSAGQIHAWLDGKVPSQVFDLRDNSETDRIVFSAGKMHRLQDIFTQIEQTKKRLKPVIEQVHLQIDLRSQLAGQLAMVRPQGWDDLCA